jgi:glycosyltransferase involved in cell wall biosynthesis
VHENPSNVLYAPPVVRDGHLYRGIVATDRPRLLLPQIARDRWFLLFLSHGACVPWPHPEIDLYQTDPCYRDDGGKPQVYVTARDFTDPGQFRPLGLEKIHDVVFNSAWRYLKRPGLLLDALTWARDRGRPISCLWFGYHWHPEGIELERTVRAEVETRGLLVTFEPSTWDRQEVNRRFNLARVAVLCSESEAGPRVMSEAMLAGLPYVTTADTAGGSPALVNDRNGRVCDPAPEALARAIWHVLDHADSYRPRDWALEDLCLPVALRRLREAIECVAESKGWLVNLQGFGFTGIDFESRRGEVQRVDAAFRP